MTTSLTWFVSAREHAEMAAAKLRWLEADPELKFAEEELREAADHLRVALNLCEDTARALKNRARPSSTTVGGEG